MIPDSLYAENIKLAADVKRKENNGLISVRHISILEQHFVCIWFQMNSKCHMNEHGN